MSAITCTISKLPILPGEEMVCIPLTFSTSYQCESGKGRVETKGLRNYTTDDFYLLGLAIKGIAGGDKVFQSIEENGNTKNLESFFEVSIESFVNILVQKEKTTDNTLAKSMAVFIKRRIYDYMTQESSESPFYGKSLAKKYDELQEGIAKWEMKQKDKPKRELNDAHLSEEEQELLLSFLDDDPFGMFSKFDIFQSLERVMFQFKRVYKEALKKNEIREDLLETHRFLSNSYNLGYYFFPVSEATNGNQEELHRALLETSFEVLKEKEIRCKEKAETWG